MNWDTVEGRWKELKGKARQRWGKISDDEMDRIGGKRDELEGAIQRAYGRSRDEAKKEVDTFADDCC